MEPSGQIDFPSLKLFRRWFMSGLLARTVADEIAAALLAQDVLY
jgi:hypothetical protein